MHAWALAVVGAVLLGYALVSRRLEGTVLTPPMVFVAVGLVVGVDALHIVDPAPTGETLRVLTTATLAVVLFTDAVRIDLRALRHEWGVPTRLLSVGLPLTIAAGAGVAGVLLGFGLWPAVVLGVVLAPTDAALGQAVVTLPSLPSRIRQGLNLESGLNDGLCVPLLLIALSVAESEDGLAGSQPLRLLGEKLGFGILAGIVAGWLGATLLRWAGRRDWVSAGWRQIALLAVPILAFGIADPLHGSGFIAAFVAGVAFRRTAGATATVETDLAEQAGEILGALTFVVFGAVILGPALGAMTVAMAVCAVLSLTLVRMAPVAVALLGSRAQPETVGFVGWFGPRGLASIVFALGEVQSSGLPERQEIITVVAITVALSVLLHGLTAAPLAQRYARWYRSHPSPTDLMESVDAPAGLAEPLTGERGHNVT